MDVRLALLALAACSGSKARGEDARHVVPEVPKDAAAAPIDAFVDGNGDVQVRVEWKDVPLAARASAGRDACGNAKAGSVSPTTLWGIPDVFVVIDAPGKPRNVEPRIVLQDCVLSPRIALAGSAVTLASGVERPAKLSLHQVGKLPFGGDMTDKARTVYLPIVGHAVSVPVDSGAIYRVDSDDASAWIVAADSPYYAITEASGAVVLRDVPAGVHAVTAWLPPRADQPARIAQGKVTVPAGGLAEVTLDISR